MPSAKDIRVEPIAAADANRAVARLHYSGTFVRNSQLHLGVFLAGRLEGVMQFGPSLDKRKIVGLVSGTKWNEFIELNRLAFSDALPRNSESRALSVAFRLIRAHAPHLKWIISFADAAQCGDGTIYRASGFVLTGIKANNQIWQAPEGEARFSRFSLTEPTTTQKRATARAIVSRVTMTKGTHTTGAKGGASMREFIAAGFRPIPGFQLRYIYFLDPTARERLTVPVIPFAKIAECGAGMYRGQSKQRAGSIVADAPANPGGRGRVDTDPGAPTT